VLARLREWCVDEESCGDAELLLSELFTNAVRHTSSDKVSCELTLTGAVLLIEVADQGGGAWRAAPPAPGEVDMDGECGRGLLLVGSLADEWGIRPGSPDGDPDKGHVVWVRLTCCRGTARP
jgi:serine/threonine-protein kinase RsbW